VPFKRQSEIPRRTTSDFRGEEIGDCVGKGWKRGRDGGEEENWLVEERINIGIYKV